ncbi:MAG: tetratricopeptide repeat protein [Myxococcales bacterium]|nr:tetratricopeptide repeat protein [Myxococcales bacterium]
MLQAHEPHVQQEGLASFASFLQHQPYNKAAHLALARYHAQQGDAKACEHHLSVCYDLEEDLLKMWEVEPSLQGSLTDEQFLAVLEEIERERHRRWWAILTFTQVQPDDHPCNTELTWKDGLPEEADAFHQALPDRVDHWLRFELDDMGFFVVGPKIVLKHNADRSYCFYGKIHHSLCKLARHVEDARFFMYGESEDFLDEFWFLQGECYFFRHLDVGDEHKQKLLFWEQLLEKVPSDEPLRQLLLQEWSSRATVYFGLFKRNPSLHPFEEVEEARQKARQYDPDNIEMLYLDALIHLEQGDKEQAREKLQQTCARAPEHFDAQHRLGKLYCEEEDDARALATFDAAAKQKPHYVELQYYRGLCLSALGRNEEAEVAHLLEIEHTAHYNAFYCNIAGNKLYHRKEYQVALLYFAATLTKGQQYEAILREKQAKETSSSSSNFYVQRHKELASQAHKAWLGSVSCYEALGDGEKAWEICQSWRDHEPDDPQATSWHDYLLAKYGPLKKT